MHNQAVCTVLFKSGGNAEKVLTSFVYRRTNRPTNVTLLQALIKYLVTDMLFLIRSASYIITEKNCRPRDISEGRRFESQLQHNRGKDTECHTCLISSSCKRVSMVTGPLSNILGSIRGVITRIVLKNPSMYMSLQGI